MYVIMTNSSAFEVKVDEGINRICDELKLTSLVRAKCIELCAKVKPKESADVSAPAANAVACAIVSIVHDEAKRNGRVSHHLPDRIIGKIFGLTGVAVVYNKRLVNTIRTGK